MYLRMFTYTYHTYVIPLGPCIPSSPATWDSGWSIRCAPPGQNCEGRRQRAPWPSYTSLPPPCPTSPQNVGAGRGKRKKGWPKAGTVDEGRTNTLNGWIFTWSLAIEKYIVMGTCGSIYSVVITYMDLGGAWWKLCRKPWYFHVCLCFQSNVNCAIQGATSQVVSVLLTSRKSEAKKQKKKIKVNHTSARRVVYHCSCEVP